MRLRVAVIGDAVLDVHVSGAAPRAGSDVPAAIRLEPGGQGANLAVRLARRGAAVRLACALADDGAGLLLRERLAAEGVEVLATAADRTGSVVVLVGPDGERSMLSQRVSLTSRLDPARLRDVAADAAWVAVSGYPLLEPDAAAVAATLASLPVRRLILGCAVDSGDGRWWLATVAASQPTLLVLNAEEATALTRADDSAEAAGRLAHDLGACVAVTEPEGAVAVVDDNRVAVSAAPAGDVIDTTGAGDAFAAALLATLGTGKLDAATVEQSLAVAVNAGTAATQVIGAQGRTPGEQDPDTLAP